MQRDEPLFSDDPDAGPSTVEMFWAEVASEPSLTRERDEPLGLSDTCHALRLAGRYHDAIEIELERFKLRRLGATIRQEITTRQKPMHRLLK